MSLTKNEESKLNEWIQTMLSDFQNWISITVSGVPNVDCEFLFGASRGWILGTLIGRWTQEFQKSPDEEETKSIIKLTLKYNKNLVEGIEKYRGRKCKERANK